MAALTASSFSTTPNVASTPTTWLDPHAGGKWGSPGARAFVGKKSMDAVHVYAADMLARAILLMTVSDFVLPIGTGTLVVKPPRVTEAKYAQNQYQMVPPNRIQSRFFDGRLAANGVWQYKPNFGKLMGGTYKAIIDGTELNATNRLGRTVDARPMVETMDCKANISHFRIEVQGSSQIKVIENCTLDVCLRIRKFYEDTICRLFEGFIKDVINRELQAVPNRMCIQGDQYKVDYGLQMGEPTVNDTEKSIRAGMEGKYIWRNSYAVPFSAPQMEWSDRGSMYSLQVSDYTFNTLLHQAHSSGYRFSAAELTSSTTQHLFSLNCGDTQSTSTPKPTPTPTPKPSVRKYRGPAAAAPLKKTKLTGRQIEVKCLGSLFVNFTNFGPYSASDMGDVVYKSNPKAPAIYVESDKRAFFDGSSGVLEFYGPMQSGGSRSLLARADVRLMRGDFIPKMNKANVTGAIKIITLELAQPSGFRTITPEWLTNAAWFATPIITESMSTFLDRYAQFPLPLPSKYECTSPEFTVLSRAMQIDCDVQRGRNRHSSSGSNSAEDDGDGDHSCTCFGEACVCPNKP